MISVQEYDLCAESRPGKQQPKAKVNGESDPQTSVLAQNLPQGHAGELETTKAKTSAYQNNWPRAMRKTIRVSEDGPGSKGKPCDNDEQGKSGRGVHACVRAFALSG